MRTSIFSLVFLFLGFAGHANVHVIIYATCDGKTGHAGIAVDEYLIKIRETVKGGKTEYRADTVATGYVRYYDLWPKNDDYKVNYDRDVASTYYQLPSSKWKGLLSVKTLADQGVPHKEGYPSDGIITLRTTPKDDLQLEGFLQQRSDSGKPFNAMRYNCCDFVTEALVFLFGRPLNARELIFKTLTSTPNRLYKVLAKWPEAEVVKDPGNKVDGSFVQQRIIGRMIPSFINF